MYLVKKVTRKGFIFLTFITYLLLNNSSYCFDKIKLHKKTRHTRETISYEISSKNSGCEISIINSLNNRFVKRESGFVCLFIKSQIENSKILESKIKKKHTHKSSEVLHFEYLHEKKFVKIDIPLYETKSDKEDSINFIYLIYSYLDDLYLNDDPTIVRQLTKPL
tara:strand:- start:180 stop:674 length:495 start_codon:yes stop_codon:yes gene_type:complete